MAKSKKKAKKLNMAAWGDLYMSVEIQRCQNPKCQHPLRNLNAFGVLFLGVCDKCRKFWSIQIVDVTKELNPKFKKENLPKPFVVTPKNIKKVVRDLKKAINKK
jgi:hypothetical protein